MSITRFFVDALAGALDVGLATPDDLLRHVTPDVLAGHLPRPLWGKLIAACLAVPRTDARLVVDTIGVPALCEHMPGTILWSIVADVATRALGKGLVASPPPPPAAALVAPLAAPVAPLAAPVTAPAPVEVAVPVPAPAVAAAPVSASVPVVASPPADKSKGAQGRSKSSTEEWSTGTPAVAPPAAADSGPASKSDKVAATAAAKAPVSTPAGPRDKTPVPITVPPAITPRAQTATVTTTAAAPAALASVPSAVVDIDFDDDDDEPAPLDAPPLSPHRAPTVPGPAATRPAASNGRGAPPVGAGASSRRPQASAAPRAGSRTTPPSPRRGAATNSDFDLDTDVGTKESEGVDVPVDDDQLIDWAASEETVTSGVDTDRKR